MVIIMDMTSGKTEPTVLEEEAQPAYGEEVLLAGWTALPSGLPAVAPRLAEVAVEAKAAVEAGTEEFLSRMYAAQGLPGRR